MARALYRLGSTAYRRWPLFLAGWLVVAIAVGAIAATVSKPFSEQITIPGIPSETASDLQTELFPGTTDAFDEATVNVVVQAPDGEQLADPTVSRQVDALVADLQALPQVAPDAAANPQLGNPVAVAAAQEKQIVGATRSATSGRGADPGQQAQALEQARADADALSPLSEDGSTGIIAFEFDVDTPADVRASTLDDLDDVMAGGRDAGLTVEANGSGTNAIPEIGATSELIGIAVAIVVLLLAFGSLVAAGMPILTALVGVALGLGGVISMTAFTDLASTTTILASMIGLAVGIDYTLFILARYRAELQRSDDRAHAAGIAVGTAGSAVVFAGLTVLIALAALAVVGIPFLTAMGLAAAATVLVAVLVALTLLPALLGVLKSKAFGGQVRRYRPAHDDDGRVLNNGVRWARLVGRAPVAVVLLVVVVLGTLALPARGLHLAFPTDSTASPDTTQRQASDLITAAFGAGREAPLLVVVDARDVPEADGGSGAERAFGEVAAWAAGQDDVRNAQVVGTNAPVDADGQPTGPATGALVQVLPSSGPDDQATEDLLTALRDGQSDVEGETGTALGVTGITAIQTDVSDRLSGALPVYLGIVIGLAFVLLMVVFRSVLVPLTATFGFLLSVLATIGVTVAVFQEGLFGLFDPAPIVSFMPIFLIGVVFGLAMDYQVFLVTRMREAHVHGMSTREAVVDGFRNSARVVTAAATIMTAVFAAFVLQPDAIVKSMGFALAAAIVFDAFVVRMVLIPALLYLLGEKAWWLPRWLDRLLPDVDVEGASLDRTASGTTSGGGRHEKDVEPTTEPSTEHGEHVGTPA